MQNITFYCTKTCKPSIFIRYSINLLDEQFQDLPRSFPNVENTPILTPTVRFKLTP